MTNIAEILKRRGIIKRTPEEIAAMASKAVAKVQATVTLSYEERQALSRLYIPNPDSLVLRWKDFNTKVSNARVQTDNPCAYAYVPSGLVVKITKNISGLYRDKHLFSLHTFFDDRKLRSKITVHQTPLVSQWMECHFINDRDEKSKQWLIGLTDK